MLLARRHSRARAGLPGGGGPTPFFSLRACREVCNATMVKRDQGVVKREPPREISCDACGHAKHPRAKKCNAPGCACECLQMHGGSKRKRARAAADAAKARSGAAGAPGGAWHPAQHRRVVHQAAFAAEAMHESRAVYAVLVARRCERTGAVVSETWGSEPWVAGELGGTTGVLEIVFRGHAARHIAAAPVLGLGDFEPVMESLRACGVASLAEKMREHNFDAAAFRALGAECASNAAFAEGALERMGVAAVGDRLKLMAAARAFAEATREEEEEEEEE